jgi:hypothetical protein
MIESKRVIKKTKGEVMNRFKVHLGGGKNKLIARGLDERIEY